MGEAKVLVEMKLDSDFSKFIALDDKQGSIFLVNVDYIWIPSPCERCGSLGHKPRSVCCSLILHKISICLQIQMELVLRH